MRIAHHGAARRPVDVRGAGPARRCVDQPRPGRLLRRRPAPAGRGRRLPRPLRPPSSGRCTGRPRSDPSPTATPPTAPSADPMPGVTDARGRRRPAHGRRRHRCSTATSATSKHHHRPTGFYPTGDLGHVDARRPTARDRPGPAADRRRRPEGGPAGGGGRADGPPAASGGCVVVPVRIRPTRWPGSRRSSSRADPGPARRTPRTCAPSPRATVGRPQGAAGVRGACQALPRSPAGKVLRSAVGVVRMSPVATDQAGSEVLRRAGSFVYFIHLPSITVPGARRASQSLAPSRRAAGTLTGANRDGASDCRATPATATPPSGRCPRRRLGIVHCAVVAVLSVASGCHPRAATRAPAHRWPPTDESAEIRELVAPVRARSTPSPARAR